jgi:hypothetical protein
MYRKSDDMSELEQEFEFEMDDLEMDDNFETGDDYEIEDLEYEGSEDSEYEGSEDSEYEGGEDSEYGDYEYEAEYEDELEGEYELFETGDTDFAERFFELSQREFESESEMDEAVDEIFDDMQREYFSFGGLLKKAAKKGFSLAKKAALNMPQVKALKAVLGPAAGMLKGNWKTLLKTALAAHPAGAAALPALKAIGFESREDMSENREVWDNYVDVVRESFEHLVSNATPNANQPMVANRLSANAFHAGLKKYRNNRGRMSPFGRQTRDHRSKNVRRIAIAPGETIVIRRKA